MSSWKQELMGQLPTKLIKRVAALQFSNRFFKLSIDYASRYFKNRDLVIRHGVGAGLKFNTAESNIGYVLGTTEPEVQHCIATHVKAGTSFYDIGAHVGFFSVLGARLAGETGRVLAFEPLPENLVALSHNAALNAMPQLRIVAAAVSNEEGKAELQLVGNSTGPKLASSGRHPDSRGSIEVDVISLDLWVARENERPPEFLKIDVEGAEIEVIKGMRGLIERHKPVILCEMHGRNREYLDLMEELGYDVCTLTERLPIAEAHWNAHTLATPRQA